MGKKEKEERGPKPAEEIEARSEIVQEVTRALVGETTGWKGRVVSRRR